MNKIKALFSEHDLKEVAAAIGSAELRTSGKVRVSVRQRRARSERSFEIGRIAWREFEHLGLTQTNKRNGVLIFLLLEDRELHICADSGIHSKVDAGLWQRLANDMSSQFKEGKYREGLVKAVQDVGSVLAEHFPRQPDDVNELPDDVRIT